jgi:hypothetical protein
LIVKVMILQLIDSDAIRAQHRSKATLHPQHFLPWIWQEA